MCMLNTHLTLFLSAVVVVVATSDGLGQTGYALLVRQQSRSAGHSWKKREGRKEGKAGEGGKNRKGREKRRGKEEKK